jgi:hypothetical protein
MTATIVNAAPLTVMQGAQDKSTRQLVAEAEALPQHLPKVFIYAEKGPTEPQLVVGASRSKLFGENSFDLRLGWATHATVLSNAINSKANSQMLQRLKPLDAAPPASIRLMLDVLPCQVPVYQRNSDGSITLDVSGMPVPTGIEVAGFKGKWVVSQVITDVDGSDDFGNGAQVAGDQTDVATSTQSMRYPICDLVVPSFGTYGNNNGLRLWAPTSKSSIPLDDRLLTQEKIYPIRMACVSRANASSTVKVVETLTAEQFVDVCLKPDTIDRNTDKLVYAEDVFIQAYENTTDPAYPPVFGPFGKMKLYSENIEALLGQFYAAEVPFIDSFSDFTGAVGEEYSFNMISGMSSSAVPYTSFQLVTGASNSIRFSETATIYAQGGTDGTMNETLFAELVSAEMEGYADENSRLQDSAKYPESIIYDSGFPLATKYALTKFIAIRKDTAVVLSTHDVNSPELTSSSESSIAIALRTRLQMYPESEFFGTGVVRGMVVGRSGKLSNSQYRKKLPLTIEIATKAAEYMGAGNGRWKSGFAFDSAPNNVVTLFTDVNVSFTPAVVRNKDWANGLNWVDQFDRRSLYFPALKTVYDNDTSVLTSFFTMMAVVELEKVGERCRRQFSGVSSLTNAQLIERVNEFVIANTQGRFDGRFIIRPDAHYTAADIARGYSWTLAIQIYAPNMKTVMTLSIESYRIEDLQA